MRVSVNDVVVGDIICRKTGEMFTVARITTPDWETLAFHSEGDGGMPYSYSETAYVEVLRAEPCKHCGWSQSPCCDTDTSTGRHERVRRQGSWVCDTCVNVLGINIRWDQAPCQRGGR